MLYRYERATSPEPDPPQAERRLRRSHSERVLAGVCGGFGQYLGIDPVLLRIAFVVLGLANRLGVIAYVVAWIVIPEERPGQPIGPRPRRGPGGAVTRLRGVDRLSLLGGLGFVLAGVVFLLDALDVWRLRGDYVVPLVLILLGVAVLASGWASGDRRR
jgi:phage shock protein C